MCAYANALYNQARSVHFLMPFISFVRRFARFVSFFSPMQTTRSSEMYVLTKKTLATIHTTKVREMRNKQNSSTVFSGRNTIFWLFIRSFIHLYVCLFAAVIRFLFLCISSCCYYYYLLVFSCCCCCCFPSSFYCFWDSKKWLWYVHKNISPFQWKMYICVCVWESASARCVTISENVGSCVLNVG